MPIGAATQAVTKLVKGSLLKVYPGRPRAMTNFIARAASVR